MASSRARRVGAESAGYSQQHAATSAPTATPTAAAAVPAADGGAAGTGEGDGAACGCAAGGSVVVVGITEGCGGGVTGGHFDPTFVTGQVVQEPGNQQTYEIGDLSGKHGNLGPMFDSLLYGHTGEHEHELT